MTRTKNIVKCEICGKEYHASGLNGHLYQKHGVRKSKVDPKKLAPSEPPKIESKPVEPATPAPDQPAVQSLEELFREELVSPTTAPDHPAFRPEGPDAIPPGQISTTVGPEFPGGGGFMVLGWGQLYKMIAEILNSIGKMLHEKYPEMPWLPVPMNDSIARQLGDQTSAVMGPMDAKKALMGSLLLCFAPAAICIVAMLLGPKTFSKIQAKFSAFVDKQLDKVKGKSDGQPSADTK